MFARVTGSVILPNDRLLLLSDGQVCSIDTRSGKASRTKSIADLFGLPWSSGKVVPLYWGCDRIIFFNGAEFQRYNLASGKPDFREPQLILTSFPGLWPLGMDAAFNTGNGKVYFLRGSGCVRYDIAIGRADEGYPRRLADEWPGLSADAVDAALCLDGFNVIFFRGNEYTRYSLRKRRVESSPEENRLVEIEPLPSGLWQSARALSSEQADEILMFLERQGELVVATALAEFGGVPSSLSQSMRVSGPVGGVRFTSLEAPETDEVWTARCRLVALWRLARWANASGEGITTIILRSLRDSSDDPNRKPAPARSIDIMGLEAARGHPPFALSVARDWGAKPSAASGGTYRLTPEDEPAYSFFRRLYGFATFECMSRGLGQDPWPPPAIGEETLIFHPDYYGTGSAGDLQTRKDHQDCIHMGV